MTTLFSRNCPIIERTGGGESCGRCWFYLENGLCPRHGDVSVEVERYKATGKMTDENEWRRRVGKPELKPR